MLLNYCVLNLQSTASANQMHHFPKYKQIWNKLAFKILVSPLNCGQNELYVLLTTVQIVIYNKPYYLVRNKQLWFLSSLLPTIFLHYI